MRPDVGVQWAAKPSDGATGHDASVGRGQKLTPVGTSVPGYFRGMRGSIESMARELAELQLGRT